jgi:hypothetical protein
MVLKPASITRVGVVQTILASIFVVWLLFFPGRGVDFAWPIRPEVSAMFIGAGFIVRAYLGVHLWRQRYWYALRWQVWGNNAFLAVLLLATFWHIDQMNWSSSIWVAHIWVLAYIIEPLTLPLAVPRGEQATAPLPEHLREGPVFEGLRRVLMVGFVTGVSVGLLLFVNPEFMDTRWPWPLDPFDARILGAFPILGGVWALHGYLGTDWAEIKAGVLGAMLLTTSFFAVWLYNLRSFDPARVNIIPFGVVTALFSLLLVFYYYKQERSRPTRAVERAVERADARAG